MRRALLFLLLVLCISVGCCSTQYLDGTVAKPTDYLTDTKYKHLVLEFIIDPSQKGPQPSSIEFVRQQLMKLCYKDNIIAVVHTGSVIKTAVKSDTVHTYRRVNAQFHTSDNLLVLHIVYVPSPYLDKPNSAGMSYQPYNLIAIFAGTFGSQDEKQLLLHEVGHMLGLVQNYGSIMLFKHEDQTHETHCDRGDCAMIWRIWSDPNPHFCSLCLADLQANGSRR